MNLFLLNTGLTSSHQGRLLLAVQLVLLLCNSVVFSIADCQEVSFTPRYEGSPARLPKKAKATPTPRVDPSSAPKLYSLARFKDLFLETCRLLEADSRRERIFTVAKAGADDMHECASCRALFRQFVQGCAPKMRLGKLPEKEDAKATIPEVAVSATPSAVKEELAASSTPTGTVPKRYPRTDLVDVLSRLSAGLHAFGPGDGPVFDALKGFEKRLIAVDGLTAGERDYYGIMLSYLFSAWAGRPGSPLEERTQTPEDVAELFQ